MISYSYSAGLLLNDKKKPVVDYKGTILAFAPSFGDYHQYILESLRSLNLSPLKFNIKEAEQIHSMTDGALFTDMEATEKNFIKEAGKYRILHLATHGILNDSITEYSCCLLYTSPSPRD